MQTQRKSSVCYKIIHHYYNYKWWSSTDLELISGHNDLCSFATFFNA